jgi:predicted RNA-binding protein with PUA-like domain
MGRTGQVTGWLFKQEPSCYSFADLERDRATIWDGVTNALALQNLRKVRPGDRVLFYHTGKEKAIVGEMRIMAEPGPDALKPDDAKLVTVKVEFVRRWPRPVGLQEIKDDKQLRVWDLVRLPRLSVVPVAPEQWRRLEELSQAAP